MLEAKREERHQLHKLHSLPQPQNSSRPEPLGAGVISFRGAPKSWLLSLMWAGTFPLWGLLDKACSRLWLGLEDPTRIVVQSRPPHPSLATPKPQFLLMVNKDPLRWPHAKFSALTSCFTYIWKASKNYPLQTVLTSLPGLIVPSASSTFHFFTEQTPVYPLRPTPNATFLQEGFLPNIHPHSRPKEIFSTLLTFKPLWSSISLTI